MKQGSPTTGAVHGGVLTYQLDGREVMVTLDSPAWFTWLDSASSFTFRNEEGHFTAHKTRAGNRRGGAYWRAARRTQGRLSTFYLGQSPKLTLQCLREAARQLQASSGEAPARSPAPIPPSVAQPDLTLESAGSLLSIKLSPPRLPLSHVPRSHLLAFLEQSVQYPITLVSAPAGWGKTTLLAEWARTTPKPVVWLSLEAADNDPMRFLSYLAAAFAHLDGRVGHHTRQIRPYAWEQVLTVLLNDLTRMLQEDAVIILDDVHLITTDVTSALLQFLTNHLPASLHLIIGTRLDPPLPLARLRAMGQLSELRAEALRFLSAEVEAFVAVMGLDLDAEVARLLEAWAEGWIAGLQLLALTLRGQADPAAFLRMSGGTHRFLLDYVGEEILKQQTPAMQRFLLHTCLLDRLTGPLCEYVMGEPGGQARLIEALQANLFVRELDETRTWYRYHPLFAEALRAHLQQQEPELIPTLYRRACDWYEQQRGYEEALEYAFRAGDVAHAAALLEQLLPHLLGHGKLLSLDRWLSQLPPSFINASPVLSLIQMLGIYTRHGNRSALANAEPSMQLFMAHFNRLVSGQGQEAAVSWRPLVQAAAAWTRGDLAQTIALARQVSLSSPEKGSSQIIALGSQLLLGSAYSASGDLQAAEQTLLEAMLPDPGNPISSAGSFASFLLVDLYEAQGQLRKLAWFYDVLFGRHDERNEISPVVLAQAQLRYAGLLYEWNRLDEAEAAIQKGKEIGLRMEVLVPGMSLRSQQLGVRIALARGNSEQADRVLQQLWGHISGPQTYRILGAVPARLALDCGQLEQAEQWEEMCGLRFDDPVKIQVPGRDYVPYITLARLLLARGRHQRASPSLVRALILLEHLRSAAVERGTRGWLLEVQVVTALVLQAQGKTKQALNILGPALAQAEQEGYIRLLVDEGQPMAHLLAQVAAYTTASAGYLQLLQTAIGPAPSVSADDAEQPSFRQPLPEPLSRREQEILWLIAEGCSNQQIAERLVISVYTVKLHVRHILAKLTVTNRTQAVAQARALHLL